MRKALLAILVMATLGVVQAPAEENGGDGLRLDPVFHFDFFQAAGVKFTESARRDMAGEPTSFGGLMVGNRINLLRWRRLELLGAGWGLIVRDRPTVDYPTNQVVEFAGTATLADLRLTDLGDSTSLHLTSSYFWGSGGSHGWLLGCSFGFKL